MRISDWSSDVCSADLTCGAILSPWGTHLSSEEYEPDAAAVAGDKRFHGFSQNLYGDPQKANPYHYGHLPEITVHADGTGSIKKHFCMGRISHELVQRSEEHTSELQSLMRISYAVFCMTKKKQT